MTSDELKAKRKALGLTQAQLAEQFGLHRVTIANWERGSQPIPEVVAIALTALVELHELKSHASGASNTPHA